MIKIVTFNINGIRAALKKGLLEWLKKYQPEIACFQEIKANENQIDPLIFSELGYHMEWNSADKKGYSGVLTISKMFPTKVTRGINNPEFDNEGRLIRTDFKDFSVYNCYFPSGSSGEVRHQFKMKFLTALQQWMDHEMMTNPLPKIFVGDYNIVHLDIDIHNPSRKDKPSGFRAEERAWIHHWFHTDFKDAFRLLHPEKIQYSWWSFRAGSRQRNKGWRIDYIAITNDLTSKVNTVTHHQDVLISDHCPILLSLE